MNAPPMAPTIGPMPRFLVASAFGHRALLGRWAGGTSGVLLGHVRGVTEPLGACCAGNTIRSDAHLTHAMAMSASWSSQCSRASARAGIWKTPSCGGRACRTGCFSRGCMAQARGAKTHIGCCGRVGVAGHRSRATRRQSLLGAGVRCQCLSHNCALCICCRDFRDLFIPLRFREDDVRPIVPQSRCILFRGMRIAALAVLCLPRHLAGTRAIAARAPNRTCFVPGAWHRA